MEFSKNIKSEVIDKVKNEQEKINKSELERISKKAIIFIKDNTSEPIKIND